MQTAETVSVRAWDVPVRLFHWALVLMVIGAVTTGLLGGNAMVWHMRCGYAVLALVLFRVTWGLVGSTTARFSDFLYGPARVLGFARDILTRRPAHYIGHNPLGGWMVLVLLLVLLFQASSGLFANDDIATEGPLAALISKGLSDRLTGWHKLNVNLIYVLVALHVSAVAFHWFGRGENLVTPMFTGDKRMPAPVGESPRLASAWRAAAIAAAAAAFVWLLVSKPLFNP